MIIEFLKYTFADCPKYVKETGLLSEIISIYERYKRNQEEWDYHLCKCKKFIIESIENCKNYDVAVVFGSGYLLDIPIEDLVNKFKKVILIDVYHPYKARKLKDQNPQIELLELDITGVIEKLWIGNYKLKNNNIPNILYNIKPDFVVSSNVLSQLSLVARNVLTEKKQSRQKIRNYCRNIIIEHLELLEQYDCIKAIITDWEQHCFDKDDNLIAITDLLYDVEFLESKEDWEWVVAPLGEVCSVSYLINHVCAMNKVNFIVELE